VTKNEIRLYYSGLIIFAAKILSVATGFIFTLLITRNTTEPELGIWSNVFDLMGYFLLLSAAIPFWATRFLARGKEGTTKTAFLANLVLGIIAAAFYLPLIPFVTQALSVPGVYLYLYVIAAAQVVELYLISLLEACLRAVKPEAVGYGLLVEEFVKVSLAILLIVVLKQPLFGAMVSLIIGVAIQVAYYVKLVSPNFKEKIRWDYVKEWLKGSVAAIYNVIGNQIAVFIFILLFIYGGQGARGYYTAAMTIANVITYSSFLSFALYPKLLANKSLQDVTMSLKMVLMFAIPMTVGIIAIPDSFLIILNESYGAATPVLFLLAIDCFVSTISQFYTYVLFGVEEVDEKAKIPLKQLLRSDIFKVFTLPYIHSAITLPTAYFVLTRFAVNQPVEAAAYVTAINMVARIAMFLVLLAIMRKSVKVNVPWRNVAKYSFAAIVMAAILYLSPHQTKITSTLGMAVAGGAVYLALIFLIDRETRDLIASIWRELRSKSV